MLSELVGKTLFLSYLLIEGILDGHPTAYQWEQSRLFLFLGPTDVQVIRHDQRLDTQAYTRAMALVDSNSSLVQPRPDFTSPFSRFYLVQTTSPQPRRWKEWKKDLSASMVVMKPWSLEEICIGGSVYSPRLSLPSTL
jgi:hypothetical protein